MIKIFFSFFFLAFAFWAPAQSDESPVAAEKMQAIYEEVKTPFKYGMVVVPKNDSQKIDCPTVFRRG